jgi:hypothetical protein
MGSKKKVADALASYPGSVTLHQNALLPYATLAIGIAATVACVLVIYPGIDNGGDERTKQILFGALLFLPCVGIATFGIRRLRAPHSITLDTNGFQVLRGDDSEAYNWKDVRNFRDETAADGESSWAGFDLVASSQPGRHRKAMDVKLPDNYGLSYSGLALLLSQWQAKALGARE